MDEPNGAPAENGAPPNNTAGEHRQFVHFTFYKLDRSFRLLPPEQREAACEEFAAVVDRFGETFPVRAYVLVDEQAGL